MTKGSIPFAYMTIICLFKQYIGNLGYVGKNSMHINTEASLIARGEYEFVGWKGYNGKVYTPDNYSMLLCLYI